MKKQIALMSILCGLTVGVPLSAENVAQKAQVVVSSSAQNAGEAAATKLTAEELSFAAKLNDANRKAFFEKLTVEQRQLAIAAAKNATVANAADEAVAKILNHQAVAAVEKSEQASAAIAETCPAGAHEAHQAK
jgi:hypothetical protein